MSQNLNPKRKFEKKDLAGGGTSPSNESMEKKVDEALIAVRTATDEMKKLASENKGTSELEEKIEKANKALDTLETKNQDLIAKQGEERKEFEATQEKIKALEIKMAKIGSGSDNPIEQKAIDIAKEIEAMRIYAEFDKKEIQKIENKYLRTDSNVEGGFLMLDAYDSEIIKKITEVSAVRSVSRTKKIDAIALGFVSRETLVTSYWTGEGDDFTESNSTYASPKIAVHSMTTLSKATNKALLGSNWDLETEITGDFVESRAQLEGAAFVNGDGVSKPTGFMNGTDITSINSGLATTYDFDGLIALTGELKDGYNPMYGMNRKELAFIRTLKDDAGNYIWRAGNMGAGVPNQINGDGYIILPDMPDRGADLFPVIYADFMKMYCVVDALQAIFLRNPYIVRGHVEFSLESWVGGQVIQAEAGKKLKCST